MVEFTSKPQKSFNPATLIIALGLFAVFVGGILLYVHFKGGATSKSGTGSVSVPGLLQAGNTDFEYYKTRIRIENVKATLGISFNGARIATISGTILNDGDRKLEALQLHITLYDLWGKLSKERTAFAIRPGAGVINKPLEPLEKRSFSIGVESIEYYWDPKKIAYEITGLKFK
jgi:hypothetical protein